MLKRSLFLEVIQIGNDLVLLSTVTGKMWFIDQPFLAVLQTFAEGEMYAPSFVSNRFGSLPVDADILDHVFVPAELDEVVEFGKLRDHAAASDSSTNVEFIVTYHCNLRCPYCDQDRLPGHMSLETTERSISYVLDVILQRRSKSLTLQFYGGEPLLNLPVVERVCGEIGEFARREGIDVGVQVTTNGTLLSPAVAEMLSRAGRTRAQVTLDGPEAKHDARRKFANGSGSFELIRENLRTAAPYLDRIDLRVNLDRENQAALPELLTAVSLLQLDNLALTLVPTFAHTSHSAAYASKCFTPEEARDALLVAWRQAMRAGFKFDWRPRMKMLPCWAHSESTFAIDPSGYIFKCAQVYGDVAHAVGHIDTGHSAGAYQSRDPLQHPECRECSLLPLCSGGCAHRAEWHTGSMLEMDCDESVVHRLSHHVALYLEQQEMVRAVDSSRIGRVPWRVHQPES